MKKNWLKYALHAAILVGVVVAAVKYLNGAEVMAALQSFKYVFAPFMLALSAGYLLLKAWRFVVLMRPFSDVDWKVVSKAFVAGQAATLLPGGIAARAGLMKQVDVPVAKSSVPVVFSSAMDQVVFIVGSLIAALWFEAARTPVLIVLGVLALLTAVALIPTTRHWLAHIADRIAKRFKVQEQWETFLDAVPHIFTRRIMLTSLAITLVAFMLKIVTLDLALRGVGLELPYPSLFLAFILPTMLGRIFPVPGGVGVTEAGMVGFLATTTQIDPDTATAAVAIFRIATILFQALLGALVYFFSWDGEEEVEPRVAKQG